MSKRPDRHSVDLSFLRGEIVRDAPVGRESWFGCGGNADLLFRPADEEDLSEFLQCWPLREPLTVIGGLANTIVRDGGIRGATVQLGKAFSDIRILGDRFLRAGCGANNASVAAAAAKAGIGGLEFLSGIPGTLGGALRMNAGAYGREMKDVLIGVEALDRGGEKLRIVPAHRSENPPHPDSPMCKVKGGEGGALLYMSYRHTEIEGDVVFIGAVLKGAAEDYETVRARMNEIKQKRQDTQPIKEFTGGSTFANPTPDELRRADLPEGTRAWQVVEMVGGRGLSIAGAQMSEKHCNFMVNTGGTTAKDLEMLGEEIRARALHQFGLELHWEIQRIGEKA